MSSWEVCCFLLSVGHLGLVFLSLSFMKKFKALELRVDALSAPVVPDQEDLNAS